MAHFQIIILREGQPASVHSFEAMQEARRFYAKSIQRHLDAVIEFVQVEDVRKFLGTRTVSTLMYRHHPV